MAKNYIWDPVRKKKVLLTPEEGVRQWLIKELSSKFNYPVHMLGCEHTLRLNNIPYRGDLVVFGKKLQPLLLAECKAPEVKITTKTFDQILRYNLSLKVKYLLVTNGKETYIAKVNPCDGTHTFITNIPYYNELSE